MAKVSRYHRLPLRPGDYVRLTEDGPAFTVVRVSPSAAYLASGDWRGADGKPLDREWSSLESVSCNAFLFRG